MDGFQAHRRLHELLAGTLRLHRSRALLFCLLFTIADDVAHL
jgi:hypothetical protein